MDGHILSLLILISATYCRAAFTHVSVIFSPLIFVPLDLDFYVNFYLKIMDPKIVSTFPSITQYGLTRTV